MRRMIPRIPVGIMLIMALAAGLAGCVGTGSRLSGPDETFGSLLSARDAAHMSRVWPRQCRKINKLLSSDEKIGFTERPSPPSNLPVWLIPWEGVDVVVPVLEYTELLLLSSPEQDSIEWGLRTDNRDLVMAARHTGMNRPIRNIFARAGQDHDDDEDHPEVLLTRSLFGPEITFFRLVEIGYENPQPPACTREDWQGEMATALALILKGGGYPGMRAVHRGAPPWEGTLETGERDGSVFWRAAFIHPHDEESLLEIFGRFAAGSSLVDFGLLWGTPLEPSPAEMPPWLSLFVKTLKSNDCSHWIELSGVLDNAPLSGRNRERVQSFVDKRCP